MMLTDSQRKHLKESKESVRKALASDSECYKKHRLKKMEGFLGIWEGHIEDDLVFTFSFEFEDTEKICIFRRIGSHNIYKNP